MLGWLHSSIDRKSFRLPRLVRSLPFVRSMLQDQAEVVGGIYSRVWTLILE